MFQFDLGLPKHGGESGFFKSKRLLKGIFVPYPIRNRELEVPEKTDIHREESAWQTKGILRWRR